MKTLELEQQDRLVRIARAAGSAPSSDMTIAPWLLALPPWKWIANRPLTGSALLCFALFLLSLLAAGEPMSLRVIIRNAATFMDAFLGFFAAFYFSSEYRRIYHALKSATLLSNDRLERWFRENISRLWGSVNLRSADGAVAYGLRDVLRNDRMILAWFASWTVIVSLVSMVAIRAVPPTLELRSLTAAGVAFLWAYSFVWTGHLVLYSLAFISQLGKLPLHYFYGMPQEMSLKSVGSVFVRLAWYGSVHFWFFLLVLHQWNVLDVHQGESATIAAAIIYSTIAVCMLYVFWQIMHVVGTQIVLSRTMRMYKAKRAAEFAFHLEKEFESFVRTPGDETFAKLRERKKQGDAVMSQLPVFSLSKLDLASFLVLVVLDAGLLIVFVRLSGQSLLELGRALY